MNKTYKKALTLIFSAGLVTTVLAEAVQSPSNFKVLVRGLIVTGSSSTPINLGNSGDPSTYSISKGPLPQMEASVPYYFDLDTLIKGPNGTGTPSWAGTLTPVWELLSGDLPSGVTLGSDGVLSGTPSSAYTGSITVKTTINGVSVTNTFKVGETPVSLNLADASANPLPPATVGTPYSGYDFKTLVTLSGENATASDVTFSGQGIPAGMTLSTGGYLSGTPTEYNTSGASFTVTVKYGSKTVSKKYTIFIETGILRANAVGSGGHMSCALTFASGVKCWGVNMTSALGRYDEFDSSPEDVIGLTSGVKQLVTFDAGGCALMFTKEVKCWGANYNGELGQGLTPQELYESPIPLTVKGLEGFNPDGLAAGAGNICAFRFDGALKCWGDNRQYQISDETLLFHTGVVDVPDLNNIVNIAMGDTNICVIVSGGKVKCRGTVSHKMIITPFYDIPTLESGVSQITAAWYFNCALKSGDVYCWGTNRWGNLGVDPAILDGSEIPLKVENLGGKVTGIASGPYHTCAIMEDKTVKCWGQNIHNQSSNTSSDESIFTPSLVANLSDVTSLAPGRYRNCATNSAREIKCWGFPGGSWALGSPYADGYTPATVLVY